MSTDRPPPFADTDRVVDIPERSRFELLADGELIGFLSYHAADGVLVLDHAEIDPVRRGEGRGEQLVRGSLDDLRRRSVVIRPACSFVVQFVADHPAYQDLVAD